MNTRWRLGDNGDGRQWWTITTEAGEIVAQAVSRQDAERIVDCHNASQASQTDPEVRATTSVRVVSSDDPHWATRGLRPIASAGERCQVCDQPGEGDILWSWREARRCTPCLIRAGGLRYALVGDTPDPEVRRAAERLLERAASATDDQDDDEDAILVARAALAGQGGGGEVGQLREALIGLAMRQFSSDGTYCWCDGPVLDPAQHAHEPVCRDARAVLAGPATTPDYPPV